VSIRRVALGNFKNGYGFTDLWKLVVDTIPHCKSIINLFLFLENFWVSVGESLWNNRVGMGNLRNDKFVLVCPVRHPCFFWGAILGNIV